MSPIYVIAIIIVVFSCLAGWFYVRKTKIAIRKGKAVRFKGQEFVRENQDKFGIRNMGTTMDNRKIYAVDPKDLGL